MTISGKKRSGKNKTLYLNSGVSSEFARAAKANGLSFSDYLNRLMFLELVRIGWLPEGLEMPVPARAKFPVVLASKDKLKEIEARAMAVADQICSNLPRRTPSE